MLIDSRCQPHLFLFNVKISMLQFPLPDFISPTTLILPNQFIPAFPLSPSSPMPPPHPNPSVLNPELASKHLLLNQLILCRNFGTQSKSSHT